jgi:hypothetical protein
MEPCVHRKISAPRTDCTNRDSGDAEPQTNLNGLVVRRFSALPAAPCAQAHDYEHVTGCRQRNLTQSRQVPEFEKPNPHHVEHQ